MAGVGVLKSVNIQIIVGSPIFVIQHLRIQPTVDHVVQYNIKKKKNSSVNGPAVKIHVF